MVAETPSWLGRFRSKRVANPASKQPTVGSNGDPESQRAQAGVSLPKKEPQPTEDAEFKQFSIRLMSEPRVSEVIATLYTLAVTIINLPPSDIDSFNGVVRLDNSSAGTGDGIILLRCGLCKKVVVPSSGVTIPQVVGICRYEIRPNDLIAQAPTTIVFSWIPEVDRKKEDPNHVVQSKIILKLAISPSGIQRVSLESSYADFLRAQGRIPDYERAYEFVVNGLLLLLHIISPLTYPAPTITDVVAATTVTTPTTPEATWMDDHKSDTTTAAITTVANAGTQQQVASSTANRQVTAPVSGEPPAWTKDPGLLPQAKAPLTSSAAAVTGVSTAAPEAPQAFQAEITVETRLTEALTDLMQKRLLGLFWKENVLEGVYEWKCEQFGFKGQNYKFDVQIPVQWQTGNSNRLMIRFYSLYLGMQRCDWVLEASGSNRLERFASIDTQQIELVEEAIRLFIEQSVLPAVTILRSTPVESSSQVAALQQAQDPQQLVEQAQVEAQPKTSLIDLDTPVVIEPAMIFLMYEKMAAQGYLHKEQYQVERKFEYFDPLRADTITVEYGMYPPSNLNGSEKQFVLTVVTTNSLGKRRAMDYTVIFNAIGTSRVESLVNVGKPLKKEEAAIITAVMQDYWVQLGLAPASVNHFGVATPQSRQAGGAAQHSIPGESAPATQEAWASARSVSIIFDVMNRFEELHPFADGDKAGNNWFKGTVDAGTEHVNYTIVIPQSWHPQANSLMIIFHQPGVPLFTWQINKDGSNSFLTNDDVPKTPDSDHLLLLNAARDAFCRFMALTSEKIRPSQQASQQTEHPSEVKTPAASIEMPLNQKLEGIVMPRDTIVSLGKLITGYFLYDRIPRNDLAHASTLEIEFITVTNDQNVAIRATIDRNNWTASPARSSFITLNLNTATSRKTIYLTYWIDGRSIFGSDWDLSPEEVQQLVTYLQLLEKKLRA